MCNCIEEVNADLAPHNGELVVNLFNPTYVFVEVMKKDQTVRKKPPKLAATYCPFCGEKYNNSNRDLEPGKYAVSKETIDGETA